MDIHFDKISSNLTISSQLAFLECITAMQYTVIAKSCYSVLQEYCSSILPIQHNRRLHWFSQVILNAIPLKKTKQNCVTFKLIHTFPSASRSNTISYRKGEKLFLFTFLFTCIICKMSSALKFYTRG